jgi:hypothetical protein
MSILKLMPLAALALAIAALTPASALAKKGGTDRPIRGTVSGTTITSASPPGDYFQEATGIGSHVGRFTRTLEGHYENTGAELPLVFVHGEGDFKMVAASGEELDGLFDLDAINNTATEVRTSTIHLCFEGGTGRFADADGCVTEEEVVIPLPTPGQASVEGTFTGQISY